MNENEIYQRESAFYKMCAVRVGKSGICLDMAIAQAAGIERSVETRNSQSQVFR